MTIDVSAVARVLGIGVQFVNLRGAAALQLPQRIAVFAQGRSDVTYSTTKYPATTAADAGNRFGFGSPIHLIMRELRPVNGDGVGSIPVTIYPLVDDGSGAAAVGNVTPSGTASVAAAYRLRASGVQSQQFTIPAGAIDVTAICRKVKTACDAVLEFPMLTSFTYGTVVASALVGAGNGTITSLAVHSGSTPKPGAWTLKVKTAVTNGGVWTLTDPDGIVAQDNITQTVGASTATVFSNQAGLDFTITDGSTDFALGATFTITVPATNVVFTSKWKGLSANALILDIVDPAVGINWAITQPTGGLVNPSFTAALNQVGNVWETLGLNAMNADDTTTLDALKTFGEGRWGDLVHAPMVFVCGNTNASEVTATTITDARKTDFQNAQLVAPGSVSLPFVVAARQLARIAVQANNNPPTDYGRLPAETIVPGTDAQQWDWPTRDAAVKAGSSTSGVADGIVRIGDVVTFYHPTGEDPPAYRYLVDVVKLQNIIYNFRVAFEDPAWAAAPLIADDEPTVNPNAKKPKNAKTLASTVIDGLADNAVITNRVDAKKSIIASVNSQNPKRLDLQATVQLSGNTNIKALTIQFGFFFGQALAA